MTPENATQKAVQAMRILNEIWHPDLPFSTRLYLADCIGRVKDLAVAFDIQRKAGWHYDDNDVRFEDQIWSSIVETNPLPTE